MLRVEKRELASRPPMFAYACPSCSQRLLAPLERAGLTTICPKCLKPLTIPKQDYSESTEELTVDFSAIPATAHTDRHTPLPHTTPHPRDDDDHEYSSSKNHNSYDDEQSDQHSEPMLISALAEPSELQLPPNGPRARAAKKATECPKSGHVLFEHAGFFDIDYAVELTAAISMRMEPPPEPPSDLRLTTGAWVVSIIAIVIAGMAGILHSPRYFAYLTLIGATLIAFGYIWRVYIGSRRGNWKQALVAAFPLVTVVRLFRRTEYHGYRPLVFVLTGLAACGFAAVGETSRNWVHHAMGTEPNPIVHEIQENKLSQIQTLIKYHKYDQLADTLRELADAESPSQLPESDHASLRTEILALLESSQADVRTAALQAAVTWAPEIATETIFRWLSPSNDANCRAALSLAHHSKHPEITTRLCETLAESDRRGAAKAALIRCGERAEPAVLEALKSSDEGIVLVSCEVLSHIGSLRSLEMLTNLAKTTESRAIRAEALLRATTLRTRLQQ